MSVILFVLVFVLLLVLSVISFGISIVRGILSMLFSGFSKQKYATSGQGSSNRGPESGKEHSSTSNRKKIFDKNEGEYANFEEII